MKNIRLGKTNLKVSEVGFGGIPIIPLTNDKAVSVVRQCFELGINFFDTANAYKDSIECGHCEEKCPYNLPIPGLLKENLALFKKCSA